MEKFNNGREDIPNDSHPDEVQKPSPGKSFTAQEKVPIKESGFGREQGQVPADEHIDTAFGQIDKGTIEKHVQNTQSIPQQGHDEFSEKINDDDDRDHGDSTTDWDAENNRTGRNK